MIGRTVVHYRVEEQLGAGGMGEVYRGYDTRLGRQVALKFLPASFQYDPDRRARFLREARAASALSSPNIAAIYDITEFDGSSVIVMEYIEGEVLSIKIARGPLQIAEALDVAVQVADALDEAHSRGVVHRDIKSSNLIITERGLVKVLDFGLARLSEPLGHPAGDSEPTVALSPQTVAGVVSGTVSYMSPEQALGRPVDHRSDLFSLGVVLYEMLAGRLPFEGNSPTEVIDSVVHREPAALARFNYNVSPGLEQIVRKALEKDQNFRYQTAREFYIDLHNLRRDLQSQRRGPTTGQHLSEHAPTALLADTEPLATGPVGQPKLQNAIAVMTFSNITKESVDDWIGSGIAETVTADLKNIHGVSVIGRERIFEVLKDADSAELVDLDAKFAMDIGRRLAANWIIGGGYQRVGDLIRITARLVDVQTGGLIKTVKIDGKIGDIFDLQDRIVYELSVGLNLKLGHSEISEIERDETKSVEAYEDFSRGILNLRTATRDSMDRAVYFLEKALEHDPGYASAWAALGAAYNLKGGFLSLPELTGKAVEFELKAIRLNPRLSQAHQWLGAAYAGLNRQDEAIDSIKEAIRLEPNNAGAYATLARAYWIGKGMIPEAISELERAVTLNPESGYAYLQLSLLYALTGDYDRAETAAKAAVELQQKVISGTEGLQVIGAHTRLGYVYYRRGRYDDAIAEYQLELEFLASNDHALRDRALIEVNQKLGAAHLRKGMGEEAKRYFNTAIKMFQDRVAKGADDPFTKYYVACLYALEKDADRAIKYLEETISEVRELNIFRARTDPDFDAIRDDPRFRALIAP